MNHTTKECVTLKDKIEELICVVQLKKYIKTDQPTEQSTRPLCSLRRRSLNRHEDWEHPWYGRNDRPRSKWWRIRSCSRSNDRPLHGHINMISSGFVGGGSSTSARKRHVRALNSVHVVDRPRRTMPPITFIDEDFHAPDPKQDDPMVITTEIVKYNVSKVLVVLGSFVNILY